jgi:hypothetical protein
LPLALDDWKLPLRLRGGGGGGRAKTELTVDVAGTAAVATKVEVVDKDETLSVAVRWKVDTEPSSADEVDSEGSATVRFGAAVLAEAVCLVAELAGGALEVDADDCRPNVMGKYV